MRSEIKKSQKIYFYDLGIRNTVIGDFRSLNLRQDKGMLWESFLVIERLKSNLYNNNFAKTYFWRTTRQQEIDYVETLYDSIVVFEFKWKSKRKVKIPKTFKNTYDIKVEVKDTNNFRSFVCV